MSACPPNNPKPDAAQFMADSPCELLKLLRVQYMQLITGNKRSHVGFKDRTSQYHNVSPDFLRREIAKLERICPDPIRNPNPHAQAAQAGGRFPGGPAQPPGFGILPAGYFSRYR